MSKVRWGVLSTAGIAQKQLIPAFGRATNAEVTAIASGSGVERAQEVADAFHIEKVYGTYKALLNDDQIDAVYIPLPNHLHKEWVIEAAKHKKHILCEKPAGLHTNDIYDIQQACETNGVLFMEAFMYYFHPQHAHVRNIIQSGAIGEVKSVRAKFSFYLDQGKETNIRMSAEKGGGAINDIGCYTIHSIRNVLEGNPESVYLHAVRDETYKVDTDAHGILKYPNGVNASFDVSFNQAMNQSYEVFGTQGTIEVPRAFRPDENGGEGIVKVKTDNSTHIETINGDQYRNEVAHISEAILGGQSDLKHDFSQSIQNMQVMDACFQSIETGDFVTVEK